MCTPPQFVLGICATMIILCLGKGGERLWVDPVSFWVSSFWKGEDLDMDELCGNEVLVC